MILGVEVWVVVALAATLTVGATVQGLVGLGIGLVAAPVTTLLAPELMPALLLWIAVMMPVVTLAGERRRIDWKGLAWALPARVPGTVVGVLCVGWFSVRELGIAVSVMVLASVLLTIKAVQVPVSRVSLVTVGFVSGVTGTTTSIGGPPMALLYQHRDPVQIRSTLAVYFVFGAGFSLVGLAFAGSLDHQTLLLGLLMAPFLVLGFVGSRLLHRVVAAHHIRGGVLLVCGTSAAVLLAKSLSG